MQSRDASRNLTDDNLIYSTYDKRRGLSNLLGVQNRKAKVKIEGEMVLTSAEKTVEQLKEQFSVLYDNIVLRDMHKNWFWSYNNRLHSDRWGRAD